MKHFFVLILFSFVSFQSFAQQTYPKAVGFIGVLHPLVSFDADGTHYNFDGSYTIGVPFGVHILKSDRLAYSLEIIPFINSSNGTSKTSNVLFHPGIIFRYPHNFNFVTRLAFETGGRYGFTPVFNKVIYKAKLNNYYVSFGLPVRFGNDKPASFGTALQLGVTF